jgi:hypothetical protein
MKAPSKKVSMIILVAVLLVTSIIVISVYKNNQHLNSDVDNFEINVSVEETDEFDLDNDGLLDWEEDLWGTDPNNSDSDGDGTPDGEEVDLGRIPTKPGPEDTNADISEILFEKYQSEQIDDSTITGQISRSFVQNYFELKSSKGELDNQDKINLISETVENSFDSSYLENDYYQINNLRVYYQTDKQTLLDYISEFITINRVFQQLLISSEESQQSAQIIKLSEKLMSMTVPQELVEDHFIVANGYYRLVKGYELISEGDSDPAASLIGLQVIQNEVQQIATSILNIQTYVFSNGITYDDEGFSIVQ